MSHLQRCCKKSGNFPKDNSNRQNQSSTGSTKMNYVHTAPLPQTEADFFDEKGLLKEYRPPVQQQQYQQMGGMFALRKIPITNSTPGSVLDPVSDPAPSPDFPFQEFPLTEVVTQSQIDFPSISDTLRKQQFFKQSHQEYRFTLEIQLRQWFRQRNERKQRFYRIREAHTIFKRFQYYFYFR